MSKKVNESYVEEVVRTQPRASRKRIEWPLSTASLLVLILATAGVIRCASLFHESLWEDEIASGWHAEMPIRALLSSTAQFDTHPPFYYLVAHFAYYWLGLGTVGSLRIPSAIAGIATVVVMFLLAHRLAGRLAGFAAAGITAISPMATWYSREGRMYALTWLLVLLSCWFLAELTERRHRAWIVAYALATGLGLLSDVSAALVLIPQGLTVLWLRDRRAVAGFVGGCLLYAPWLPSFRDQLGLIHAQHFPGITSTPGTWVTLIFNELGVSANYASVPSLLPVSATTAVLVSYALLIAFWLWSQPKPLAAGLVGALTIGPFAVGLLLAATGVQAVLVPRVLGLIGFGAVLTVSLGLEAATHRGFGMKLTALVALTGLMAGLGWAELTLWRSGSHWQPWRAHVATLVQKAAPEDSVIVYPALLAVAVQAYAPDSFLHRRIVGTWVVPDADMHRLLVHEGSRDGTLWILYLSDPGAGVDMPKHDAFLRAHGFERVSGDPYAYMGLVSYRVVQ